MLMERLPAVQHVLAATRLSVLCIFDWPVPAVQHGLTAKYIVFTTDLLMHVLQQELTDAKQAVEPGGALHKLVGSAPGFSTAHRALLTLVDHCAAIKSRLTAPAAVAAAVPSPEASRTAQAASNSFSQQLELVIESLLLWAQNVHKSSADQDCSQEEPAPGWLLADAPDDFA